MNHQNYKIQNGDNRYSSFENTKDGKEKLNKSSHVLTMKTFEIQENRISNSENNNIAYFSSDIKPYLDVYAPNIDGLTKYPAITKCLICKLSIETMVEKRMNGRGWMWIFFWIIFNIVWFVLFGNAWMLGRFVLSFLPKCFDYFNEWFHSCPYCKRIIAKYSRPSLSKRIMTCLAIAAIVGISILILQYPDALFIFLFINWILVSIFSFITLSAILYYLCTKLLQSMYKTQQKSKLNTI